MSQDDRTGSNDDELLASYVDGELGVDEIAALRARVNEEPALAVRMMEFVHTSTWLRLASARAAEGPVPERLLRAAQRPPRARPHVPLALAASVVVGLVLGISLRGIPEPGAGGWVAGLDAASWRSALDTTESGAGFDAPDARGRVRVAYTFVDHDSAYCRVLRREAADGPRALERALACRDADGAWRLRLASTGEDRAAAGAQENGANGYVTAAGSPGDAFDRAVSGLMGSAPLAPELERRAIEAGWPAPDDL